MARIGNSVFGGIRPIQNELARRLLADTEAQVANNCDLDTGTIRPLRDPTSVEELDDDLRISLYPAADGWLTWPTDVDVVKSPIALDDYDRIFFTGDGVPKVRGLLEGVYTTYDLGIPSPTTAPGVTVAQLESSPWEREWHSFYEEPNGDQVDQDDHTEGESEDIVETVPGKTYYMAAVPARVTASAVARFVLYFDAYRRTDSGTRVFIGRVYPKFSDAYLNSDLYIQSAKVDARQDNDGTTATFTLTYKNDGTTNYTADRSYVYTFVDVFGSEGPPSPPSEVVPVDPTQQVNVHSMETTVSGTRNIVAKRIYRTVTGDAGTDFQFIKEIAITDTAWGDNVLDEDADEILPSTTWYPPPEGLKGLIAMPGAFLVGFTDDRTVHMSEVNQPHAWPSGYDIVVDDEIVGLSVSDNAILVTTTGLPVIITAPDPQNISQYVIPSPQPCRAKRSLLQWGGAIFYASDDGVVQAQGNTAVVITDTYIDKATWQGWHPDTMIFAVFENRLLIFSDNITLIITMGAEGAMSIVTRDEIVQGVYVDTENNAVYVIIDDQIMQLDAGVEKEVTWRGKEYVFTRPVEFSCARVTAEVYPLTLRLYGNNEATVSVTIQNNQTRRLPKARSEKFWAFEIVASGEVSDVAIASNPEEI